MRIPARKRASALNIPAEELRSEITPQVAHSHILHELNQSLNIPGAKPPIPDIRHSRQQTAFSPNDFIRLTSTAFLPNAIGLRDCLKIVTPQAQAAADRRTRFVKTDFTV
jgi:hypothetical protein